MFFRFVKAADPDGDSALSHLTLQNTLSYEEMRQATSLGMAMPAQQETAMPSARRKRPPPTMQRLPKKPYYQEHHTAKEWVGQLPLGMVATLVPSKDVRNITRQGITGWDAIKKEWENL